MAIFRPGPGPYALPLAMSGIKMGERLLFAGDAEAAMFAALAAKVGLSGRACAIAEDAAAAARLNQAGAREGVLVEVEAVAGGSLPFEPAAFDLAVIAGAPGYLAGKQALLAEAYRTLRHGGRAMMVIRSRSGLAGWLAGGRARLEPEKMLAAVGFRPVRTLARKKGLTFVEGLKSTP